MTGDLARLFRLETEELALVISLIALLFPVLVRIYKWLRTDLDYQGFRTIEFYYGQFNSNCLGMIFTVMARHGRFFVRSVSVRVLQVATGEFRDFEWILNRSRKLAEVGGQHATREESAAEIASPFVVGDGECRTLDLMLIDWPTNQVVQGITSSTAEMASDLVGPLLATHADASQSTKIALLLQMIRHNGSMSEKFESLAAAMFWKASAYAIELEVSTDHGIKRYYFGAALHDEVMEVFKENFVLLFISAMQVNTGMSWNSVTVPLVPVNRFRGRLLFWMTRHVPGWLGKSVPRQTSLPPEAVAPSQR